MDKTTRNIVLTVATLSGFLSTFAATSISIALKEINLEFTELSAPMLVWITFAYIIGAAALLMPAGRFADIFGRMRIFMLGVMGFTIFGFASAFAPSGAALIAIRGLQGLAASMIFATNIALASLSQPPEKRGQALGILTAGVYLGGMTGPLGGVIVHYLSWRFLLGIVAGVGLVICVLWLWKLRGVDWKEPRQARFDRAGSVIWFFAFPAFILGLTLVPELVGVLVMAAGALGLAAFVWQETRAADPILDVRLLRHNRLFATGNAAALINYSANYSLVVLVSLYLQYNLHLNAAYAGYVLVASATTQTLVSPFAGRLADRLPPRLIVSTGMALCTLGLLSFAFLGEASSYWHIIPTLCVLGLGFALFSSPNAHIVMSSVERRRAGMASATLATVRVAGQSLSLAMAGLILALVVGRHQIAAENPNPTDLANLLTSVRLSFAIAAGLCVLGMIVILVGTRLPSKNRTTNASQ